MDDGVHVEARALWLPRRGHGVDEYEDAWALPEGDGLPLRAAVADGATETAFARGWARLAAAGAAALPELTPAALADALPAWRRRWEGEVRPRLRDLPWWAAAKADEGAAATLLALDVGPDGTWHALAVGDCNLIHLHAGGVAAWPHDDPAAFGHTPALLHTAGGEPDVLVHGGRWRPGDAFVLATDAAAAWLLRAGPAAVLEMDEEAFEEAFEEAVEAARADGALRNDDVTVVVVRLGRGGEAG